METQDKEIDNEHDEQAQAPEGSLAQSVDEVDQGTTASQLGAQRYVLAGFFAAAIAIAYVAGRTVSTIWNKLADSQWAVDKAAFLTRLTEDGRATWGTVIGAAFGLAVLIYTYRREDVRTWVNEAAIELAKVTWPTKKDVTNNTIVVIVASIIATVYLALLDRFWSFVTNLVYGA
jgi:preprotein translocase subunit SecE